MPPKSNTTDIYGLSLSSLSVIPAICTESSISEGLDPAPSSIYYISPPSPQKMNEEAISSSISLRQSTPSITPSITPSLTHPHPHEFKSRHRDQKNLTSDSLSLNQLARQDSCMLGLSFPGHCFRDRSRLLFSFSLFLSLHLEAV